MATKGKYMRSPVAPRRVPVPQKEPPSPEPEEQEMTSLQRVWQTVSAVFTYGIMALAVAMMLFTTFSVSSFDRNDRDILGYKFLIVRSDSMKATDFSAGDLVVIRETDPASLAVGDIISFRSQDPASMGETFTHKIRSIDTDDYGRRSFVTYGTTTGVDDSYPVRQADILGQYLFAVKNAGKVFAFMKTPMGYICCIGLPFFLMLIIQGANSIRLAKQLYQEKQQEAQSRLDAITARQEALEEEIKQLRQVLRELRRQMPKGDESM